MTDQFFFSSRICCITRRQHLTNLHVRVSKTRVLKLPNFFFTGHFRVHVCLLFKATSTGPGPIKKGFGQIFFYCLLSHQFALAHYTTGLKTPFLAFCSHCRSRFFIRIELERRHVYTAFLTCKRGSGLDFSGFGIAKRKRVRSHFIKA